MKIKLKSKEEYYFEAKEELKVGTIRIDFDKRYNGPLCEKWFPTQNMYRFSKQRLIDPKEIQQVVKTIENEMVNSFDKVVRLCDGIGYNNSVWRYFRQGSCNYTLKFIPVVTDYNLYIYIYAKGRMEASK